MADPGSLRLAFFSGDDQSAVGIGGPAAMKERRLIVPSISRSIGPPPLPERARGSSD